jgi:putative transposase
MRQSRLADEQMVRAVEGPGNGGCEAATESASHNLDLAQAFGALGSREVRRLCELEAENARLRKLVAERDLEIEVMTAA